VPAAVQQPFGHDVALQTHAPALLQVWPAGQVPHIAPPVPHDEPDCAGYSSHLPVEVQQPPGQVLASQVQAPLVVSHRPLTHAPQAAPAAPHSVPDCEAYGTQVLPLQQPFGHEVASHTQVPLAVLHSWPAPHGAQALPPVPHDVVDSDAQGWHVPLDVQQPSGHDFASHTQVPLGLQSCPAGQAEHAAPAVPHDELDSPE
jgi:hypothetical protein